MKRSTLRHALLLAPLLLMLSAPTLLAQIPDSFENLKVFPKDIGKEELVGQMRDMSAALGVRCTFCHHEKTPGDHRSIDWASDELAHKRTARGMLEMVQQLNGDLLPAAFEHSESHEDAPRVRCITCHRGLENPETLDRVILGVARDKGVDAAIARYRELKDEYYGSGSYDFSAGTLVSAAQSLAQEGGDLDGALALVELDLEAYPEDTTLHTMKAQLLLSKDDKDGARKSAERALELDAHNRAASRILEQLK